MVVHKLRILSEDFHLVFQTCNFVDRGRFGPCENDGVEGAEHSDPREPLEDHHWGLGFLSSLTEVVEEDMTSDDETSSDDSSTEAIKTEITSSDEDVGEAKVKYVFSCTDIRFRWA